MLENLDKVEWVKLDHVYLQAERIPNRIGDLLSDDKDVREESLDFLLGGGQDTGTICETTAYIIPFMIELLSNAKTPDRNTILWKLTALAPSHREQCDYSVHQVRRWVRVIDALDLGIPVYIQLLKAEESEVREAAAELLGELNGSAEIILPQLVERFEVEPAETVKAMLVNSMGKLISDVDFRQQIELCKEYASFFVQVVENDSMLSVRVAAACASLRMAGSGRLLHHVAPEVISSQTGQVLVEGYWQHRNRFEGEELIHWLAHLGTEALFDLLSRSEITPDEAHLIGRGILANAFLRSDVAFDRYWWCEPRYQSNLDTNKYFYEFYSVRVDELRFREAVLHRLVEVDVFWEIPTNLLSFFFGLPDSREELRALIEKT